MRLESLLKNIDHKIVSGSADTEIKSVRYDSRKVEKGDLFVCITGFQTDGHKYAASAVEKEPRPLSASMRSKR